MRDSIQPPAPLRPDLKAQWMLDERITFLNHGSFGALPRCVFEEQTEWRRRIEADPVEIISRRRIELLEKTKSAIGTWLGMRSDDFGLVTNATDGINAVLRSLTTSPGDELVTTNHVYNAIRKAMQYVAQKSGAGYREIDVPLPVHSSSQIAQTVLNGLSSRTRLLVIDHVTSPTALVFPVQQITAECSPRGIDVLVDGAHAPGMLPLNVPSIGAAYYAGNLHKWAQAPKGTGFIWVRPDKQSNVHPLVVSHHFREGFVPEFGWQGTRDFSSWFSVPRALEFMSELGWENVMAHNHQMAAWAQQMLCEKLGVPPINPLDGSLLGSMCTIRLPSALHELDDPAAQVMQQRFYSEFHVEVPIMRWHDRCFVRPCCQVYNDPGDYERLAEMLMPFSAIIQD